MEWFRRVTDDVNAADRAIVSRLAELPASALDPAMRALSTAANHSLLWLAIAALLASRQGVTRRAAWRAVVAIGGASFVANAVLKPLVPRRRPPADVLPAQRTLADPPTSSSFPSGHAASAAAFTAALWIQSPKLAMAVAPVAAAVAYSRVHVGVHWPSDVVAGVAVGTGVARAARRVGGRAP